MTSQLENIKAKLTELRLLDIDFELFGSKKHRYSLNTPLSIDIIKAFEVEHKILLPKEYVAFLTTLGNGGAGPFYGLEPFENVLFDDLDYIQENSILKPSSPFPHKSPWNLIFEPTVEEEENEDEFNRQYEAFTNAYFDNKHMNGVIAICNYGCGISLNLVVNGEEYGTIWTDDRGNDGGIYPSTQLGEKNKITFLDWYELWLDNSIEKIKTIREKKREALPQQPKKPWWKVWQK